MAILALMIKLLIPIVLLVLNGCTQGVQSANTPVLLDQIKVVNQSNQILTSVKIEVLSTRSKIVCGQVASGGFCAFNFKARPLLGETAQVDWQIGDQRWQELISASQADISPDWYRVGLTLALTANGQAKIIAVESD